MPRLLSPEYAAGLFDGEGSVGIYRKGKQGIISPDVAGEQLRAMKRHVFPLEGGDGDR